MEMIMAHRKWVYEKEGLSRDLASNMEDITERMGVNQKIVGELKKETTVFDNL